MNPRLLRWLLPLAFALLLLAAWQAVHHSLPPSRRFLLPDLARLANAFREHGPALLSAASHTALAALGGFALAAFVSVGASLLLASSALIRTALYPPYLMALQMVPIIIVAPILILWVGPGAPSVVIVTFLISFFPLVVNTTQGLLSVDRPQVDLFRMGRACLQELFLLRAPAALPYFFTGLRISAILAPIGALTADYLVGSTTGGRSGLGITALIFSARNEIPGLYATAIVGCALGFILVAAVSGLAWLTLRRWHDSYSPSEK